MIAAPLPVIGKGALELDGVSKTYGEDRVVDTVHATIRPGEFFSLLGPSGSGKTTTLMMIAGFVLPDGGTIRVDGADFTRVPPQRRGLGMVFQNYAIFPHLNVFENVAFPLRARHVPASELRERVQAALELVQLDRFAQRYARQLSGGQQQRVAIARAIVFHPSIVLMDEPLGALDKNLRYDMQVEIKEIQQRLGMTVVYVTHDQEEAMNMSDRIAIMNHGRIEQLGPPSEIYERPLNAFVGRFLGEANLIEGTLERIEGGEALLRTRDGLALRARFKSIATPGRAASLFVRPEKLAFGGGSDANQVEGTVRRRSFLGNIIRTVVDAGQATHLTVDLPNLSDGPGPEVGARVTVGWSVAHSLILLD
ncbi:MAG: ABC transporter ATP-binding protein [Acetobacteraceae bacterium]|nr:ABC transporter ATP-binding protein [Acetobacteraceae bacterium]